MTRSDLTASLLELREAHDRLAPVYAEGLAGLYEQMPVEQAVLGLFGSLVGRDGVVADLGCGTGRMLPHLAALGLRPSGVDLSPAMVHVAQQLPFAVSVADLRALPYATASLDGALCWYSLMYLPPAARREAFAEVARVVRPGGTVAVAYKVGDDTPRRGGARVGVAFDIWWHSPEEVAERLDEAGFRVVLNAVKPQDPDDPDELQPQGYVVAHRLA